MADGRVDRGTPAMDRLSALPDEILHLLLSRLPSDKAVQTCVLGRRWRDLWRFTPSLRTIAHRGGKKRKTWTAWTLRSLTNFVNHLLLLRASGAPMDEVEISCGVLRSDTCYDDTGHCSCDDEGPATLPSEKARGEDLSRSAGMWIRHALSVCHARALTVSLRVSRQRLRLDGVRFASHMLTTATISDAAFESSGVLDFSTCTALEDLKMSRCKIHVMGISSRSVRRLSITDCSFDSSRSRRTRISAPCAVSLELEVRSGRAPFIESMPSLEAARVRIRDECADMCGKADGEACDRQKRCDGCRRGSSSRGKSVLLEGLSRATELELTSYPRVFIFRKDCNIGTTLANLKVLLLNEWCMVADFAALVYFLRCSPILEKLTLQLEYCENKHAAIQAKGNHRTKENFLVSEQLKVVKIKCPKENELVANVLMVLSAYGISKEQINIEQNLCPPTYDGYESTDSEDYY
ncbi:hypothetical protein EJB05_28625, partial [Eragrostis curvula]